MRSPISLGIVFIALAGLCFAGIPGAHLTPVGYALVVLLCAAGLMVMTRLRAGYYFGIGTGGLIAISGLISWAGIGAGRFSLPVHPGVSVMIGLYLCLRIALAHRQFGPRPVPKPPTAE